MRKEMYFRAILNSGEVSVPVGPSPSISLLATALSAAFSISNLGEQAIRCGTRLEGRSRLLPIPVVGAPEVPNRQVLCPAVAKQSQVDGQNQPVTSAAILQEWLHRFRRQGVLRDPTFEGIKQPSASTIDTSATPAKYLTSV